MVTKTIRWEYFGFGFLLAVLLMAYTKSKKVAIEVVPTAQDEGQRQYPHVVKQAAGQQFDGQTPPQAKILGGNNTPYTYLSTVAGCDAMFQQAYFGTSSKF